MRRLTFADRALFIPKGATLHPASDETMALYEYTAADGRLGLARFDGRKARPTWRYGFKDAASRDRYLARVIEEHRAAIAERAKRRRELATERSRPHGLEVGSILVSSWGYDQTNVDFYQVVKIPSPLYVVLHELLTIECPGKGDAWSSMTGRVIPGALNPKATPFRKRVGTGNAVRLKSYSSAYPWNGLPRQYSCYA